MPRAYHNLDGFLRDLKRAIEAGDQRAYECAEAIEEALDLLADTQPVGAGDGEDDMLDADGGEGAGASHHDAVRQLEDDHPDSAGVVRVGGGSSRQQRLPLADSGGARSRPAVGRTPVLTGNVELRATKVPHGT